MRLLFKCPACESKVVPLWDPYEGLWVCGECMSERLDEVIPVGPANAEFDHNNLNWDL